MKPLLIVRTATAADLDAVLAIEQECFAAAGDAFSRRLLRGLICHVQGAFFVAEREGNVVGYISLLTRRGTHVIRVYSVAVSSAIRGCGVGQSLLDAAIVEAQRRGLSKVSLEVRADNSAALRLYEKNGFRFVRRLEGYYHDGSDGVRLVRCVEV